MPKLKLFSQMSIQVGNMMPINYGA